MCVIIPPLFLLLFSSPSPSPPPSPSFPPPTVASVSLLIQNTLLLLCAVVLALMFQLDLGACSDTPTALFAVLCTLVILLGAGANLATVANTISIEKDWIVVIADKNEKTLAGT